MADPRRGRRRIDDLAARIVRNVLPRTPDFGALLAEQAAVVVEVLTALVRHMETGDPLMAERVSALEKSGDRLREQNVRALSLAFSTTFDRDLTAVAIQRIDDVANYAKTTVREMQVLDLGPDEQMRAMAHELLDGARALREAAAALTGEPGDVREHVRAVHKHERNVERHYRAAIAALFPADPAVILRDAGDDRLAHALGHLLDAIRRREVYRHLSNAADRLDAAGRILQEIAIATV